VPCALARVGGRHRGAVPTKRTSDWKFAITKAGTTLINLQQDTEGFIRMNRHFPDSSTVSITFTDGSAEVFLGRQLNEIYDEALAVYRAQNHLDAKGYSRGPRKTVHQNIEFVPVSAGMTKSPPAQRG
jgi:hypothetical protein